MAFSPTATAKQITAFAERLGLGAGVDHSGISSSTYLTIWPGENTGADVDVISIRLSNHTQRPTYYRRQNYEFGDHADGYSDWKESGLPMTLLENAGVKDPTAALEGFKKEWADRSIAAGNAAATRAENTKARRQNIKKEIDKKWPGPGRLPAGREIAARLGISAADARATRADVQDARTAPARKKQEEERRKKTAEWQRIHGRRHDEHNAGRPSGSPRSSWAFESPCLTGKCNCAVHHAARQSAKMDNPSLISAYNDKVARIAQLTKAARRNMTGPAARENIGLKKELAVYGGEIAARGLEINGRATAIDKQPRQPARSMEI